MANYIYKATDSEGKVFEGKREAPDKFTLFRQLKKEGVVVLHASEEGKRKHFEMPTITIGSGVSTQEKIVFARNIGSMLEAGLALSRVLSVLERQTKNKRFKKIITELNESVKSGSTLSDAMVKYPRVFSTLFVSMVKAGEEGGKMAESFRIVANQMEKMYLIQKKVRGALIYPAIIVLLMIAIGILMFVFIVPTLTATFKELNVELPLSTRIVMGTSDFLRNNYLIALAGIAAIAGGLWMAARSVKGKRAIDWMLLRIPVIGNIIKQTNAARTTRTLSSLLTSGVDYVVAMQITRDVIQNSYYKDVLEEAKSRIQKGDPISEVFIKNEYLYPIFVGEMMSVGEETGRIAEMMNGVAVFYESEVEQKTKDMSTIIEPFLMIFIGIAVGFFAVSMLSPMYSLMDNL